MRYQNQTYNTKDTMVIFAGRVARELLHRGFTIIDIKPDRTNNLKSVFVFKVENDIEKHVSELTYSDTKNTLLLHN